MIPLFGSCDIFNTKANITQISKAKYMGSPIDPSGVISDHTYDQLPINNNSMFFPMNTNILTCDILTTSITPHVSLNPQAEIFVPINSYAVDFSPEQK